MNFLLGNMFILKRFQGTSFIKIYNFTIVNGFGMSLLLVQLNCSK